MDMSEYLQKKFPTSFRGHKVRRQGVHDRGWSNLATETVAGACADKPDTFEWWFTLAFSVVDRHKTKHAARAVMAERLCDWYDVERNKCPPLCRSLLGHVTIDWYEIADYFFDCLPSALVPWIAES